MIRKLLIANRGEIAVRIIRTARTMGIRTVAVFSDADAESLHTKLADQSVHIGASEPLASYLNIDKIIAAAKSVGAEAIHPGYGFLSENAAFADACEMAGIIFVGPPVEAMQKLGAKIDAKEIASANGVPIVPGFFEKNANEATLKKEAKKIGYPLMLKASAGGGGRGMRVVRHEIDFDSELKMASEEALNAFGDGSMMIEKLIERPRHIEVQILADAHGNVAALFERECSIQRRHQKLIEETPAAKLAVGTSPSGESGRKSGAKQKLDWVKLRDAAIALAKASGYQGAGTVEFMFDESSGKFYFLEVNTRLQVEHPVTELATGLDLVALQLKIASGERLDLPEKLMKGDRSAICGHAIEARIVAEDPAHGFMPSSGKIVGWAEPKGPCIRVDTGFCAGAEVTRFYDSLLAKVIVHAPTRDDALARLEQALLDFHILGVKTNIPFTLEVLRHPAFRSGDFDTDFLAREFTDWAPISTVPIELGDIAAAATDSRTFGNNGTPENRELNPAWSTADGYRNN